jgi:hypothetical protein
MILYHDEDRMVPVTRSTTCAYHQQHPGQPWAGCACSISAGYREATPEEYAARRRERLARRRAGLEAELRGIVAELGDG